MTGDRDPAGVDPAGGRGPEGPDAARATASGQVGADVRALDLTGRERHLRSAMGAMAKVGVAFTRAARRTLPFLVRQKARVIAGGVAILDTTEGTNGPAMEVALESDDGVGWGSLRIDTGALSIILEGALGGRETSAATELGSALTLAQRALVSRVAKSLAEDFAAALMSEAGLPMHVGAVQTLSMDEEPDAPETDGLSVPCTFEGIEGDATMTLATCAEALEASVREHEGEDEPVHGDPRMAEAMYEVPVEVVAELGRVRLGLRRVLAMRVGEVLRLPTAIDDPVIIRVARLEKLKGVPVISRGQLSVEIKGRHGE